MEHFVITVDGFQPLTLTTKSSILDVAAVLHSSLLRISLGAILSKKCCQRLGGCRKIYKVRHVRIGWSIYRKWFKSSAQYVICPSIGFLLASNISFKTSQWVQHHLFLRYFLLHTVRPCQFHWCYHWLTSNFVFSLCHFMEFSFPLLYQVFWVFWRKDQKLHLRCLTGFWISLWWIIDTE